MIAPAASPDLEKEMAAGIPASQFLVIEGAGHVAFMDQPEKFDDPLQKSLQAKVQW